MNVLQLIALDEINQVFDFQYQRMAAPHGKRDFLAQIGVDPATGLTRDEAMARRALYGMNRVTPPVNCPSWVCCLLPCLLRTPSMQAYQLALPKEAVVRRKVGPHMRRMRMDTTSLVVGDVLELQAGDIVGADVRVIECSGDCVVDQSILTGDELPEGIDELESGCLDGSIRARKQVQVPPHEPGSPRTRDQMMSGDALDVVLQSQHLLPMTSKLQSGNAVGVVIATGDDTVWGSLLAHHDWPKRSMNWARQSEERSLMQHGT